MYILSLLWLLWSHCTKITAGNLDTYISDALAILQNALVQGEVSLQGEEDPVSVCVYKFLCMQHP